ncbi:MAG: adenosylmethionine--8-amino-7-oxononanoate transaminase [Pseudomonadales bacterium]|nr:adenosylmethionine--8-amino-7-oxononanoate transaminase [Pseudomonadales bacterium]
MANTLWYPYAQMKNLEVNHQVKSAQGVHLHLADGSKLIDGISSWWSVSHGYHHPELDQALKDQLEKYAHVMLGGLSNEPAVNFSEKLVEITPDGLNHVFFADSGSVGVEVSLKMAVQYWHNLGRANKNKIIALNKAYHGDTCGCMSVCDPAEGMHKLFSGITPQQFFLDAPTSGYDPDSALLQAELGKIEKFMIREHENCAALIVEPLMQAAGGFNFYSPEYLKQVKALCEKYEILLIADEVATGFGRTGTLFACEQADICPDIMVLGKGLTAGYIGHSATIATTEIFNAFLSDDPSKAFMHGPTFMGNALACSIGLKSIEIFQRDGYLNRIKAIEEHLKSALLDIKSDKLKDIRVLGATGVFEVYDKSVLAQAQAFAIERGVWLRPFESYLYTMPPYVIDDESLVKITDVMREWAMN